MKIIEVLLSILFIFLFLSTISSIEIKNYNRIKIQVFYALKSLDYNNELRNLVFSNDTEKLEKRLKELLPLTYDYKVCINCYLNLESREVTSVTYFISTNFTHFQFYQINVYIIKT